MQKEFHDVKDMIQQLNDILSRPDGFPQIPETRNECQILQFPSKKRNGQYVMCPGQECESLVYHADQSRSMIEALGLDQNPFWVDRIKAFYGWYSTSASKTSLGPPQIVQIQHEKGLRWKDLGEMNVTSRTHTCVQAENPIHHVQLRRTRPCPRTTNSSM